MSRVESASMAVVIVTYGSAEVIGACLDSLLRSDHPDLRIVICDNASPDDTVARIRDWAAARGVDLVEHVFEPGDRAGGKPGAAARLTLLRSARNLGFAGGVNAGLRTLLRDPGIGLFWILNPDSEAAPGTASAYARMARETGPFALMGGRTIYHEPPNAIQSDGGRVNRLTGICSNVNQGLPPESAQIPAPATLDFISGANVVASRSFIERAGLLEEDYFLYYEEVDWAFRRGDLPLVICPGAVVHHHGGTAIGSGSATRRPSGFANYFNFRNRMRFVRRFNPWALPFAYGYSMLKVGQLLLLGARDEAVGALRGLHQLAPPAAVRARLSPDAAALAFGPARATGRRRVAAARDGERA